MAEVDPFFWLLWLLPVVFFWANCPCCGQQTCGGLCPDGAPEQYQATIPDGTFTEEGTPDQTCSDTECAERGGVVLVDLVPADEAEDYWQVSIGGFPAGSCVYIGPVITVCLQYQESGIGGPIVEIEIDIRWIVTLGSDGKVYAMLHPVDEDEYPTGIDFYLWEVLLPEGWECGDEIPPLEHNPAGSGFGVGCVVDTGQELTLELPP